MCAGGSHPTLDNHFNYIFHLANDLRKSANARKGETLPIDVRAIDHQSVLDTNQVCDNYDLAAFRLDDHAHSVSVTLDDLHPNR